jgi:glycosyltransferase involved in cell wall biosynthesis
MPRILTFTTLFPNAEQPLHALFVRERIRALATRCDVTVVAPVPWAPPVPGLPDRYATYRRVPRVEQDGPTIVHHPRFVVIPKLLKSTDPFLMAASCVPALHARWRERPFDLIDAHWACPDGVAAAVLARHMGVPFTVTVRGDDINVFANERGRGPLIRWMLKRAALVIALSDELRCRVDELTGHRARVAVVPNGVDIGRFRMIDRAAARQRLGFDAHARVLVTVGRLHASKGIPQLIEALSQLPTGFEDVHLFIVGAHDPEADARGGIAESVARYGLHQRVHLVGPQAPDRLVDWYNAASLFCSATTREGSPNVLLEAMACGLPCVTTPVGGNRDAVEPRVGMLVSPQAPDLAKAIAVALGQEWDREWIAARARRRTWAVVADECRDHLLNVCQTAA